MVALLGRSYIRNDSHAFFTTATIMFSVRILAIFFVFAMFAFSYSEAAAPAACADALGDHCGVFRSFCDDSKWASLKGKCAKTCRVCK
ncbi:unnamed protein product [Cylicocyclus nassatus]|uniref:ShKT domain-containing protein n=1 Tax=Cylicocyclus nassatus TaxID=53992 RepID=A0AA36M5P3_CYLNA|nr:unnamed protein product [Cylicocyclus nassatus]